MIEDFVTTSEELIAEQTFAEKNEQNVKLKKKIRRANLWSSLISDNVNIEANVSLP